MATGTFEEIMKILLALIFFIVSGHSFGATCTTTSRNNYSTNSILTSSALNSDFNQLVTKANAMDAGCLTDGTLEAAALNSTEFAALNNGIMQGCRMTYSDSNTLTIDKCIMTIGGAHVKTTVATSVTWGCTGCSAEASSTTYYLYVKTGSTGTTLNPLISTVAPGADGLDVSGNRVVGKFYNNSSSNIEQNAFQYWATTGLTANDMVITPGSARPVLYSFKRASNGTVSDDNGDLVNGNCTNVQTSVCTFNSSKYVGTLTCTASASGATSIFVGINTSSTDISIGAYDAGGAGQSGAVTMSIVCHGVSW